MKNFCQKISIEKISEEKISEVYIHFHWNRYTYRGYTYRGYTYHSTVFRKAYILSGSGFHEILYSIIESFLKNREIAGFIPNPLRFHEKKLLEGRIC